MFKYKSVLIFLSGLIASYLLHMWHGNDTSLSSEGLFSNLFLILIVLPYTIIGFLMVLYDINNSINSTNKDKFCWIKIVYNFIKLSLGLVTIYFAFMVLYNDIVSKNQLGIYSIVVPIMLAYIGIYIIYNAYTHLKNRDCP